MESYLAGRATSVTASWQLPFATQISAESGYELEFVLEPDPGKKAYWEDLFPTPSEWQVGIQIYHDARPELPVITATTRLLRDKAEELGGSYDGWETSVEGG